MKKTILISSLMLIAVLMFAMEDTIGTRNISGKDRQNRTEVIAYQETFEDGMNGWTTSSTLGQNIWHIDTVADAPSPTHAMLNQNASGTYNPSMQNFLISPTINLPYSGTIRADVMMTGLFNDPDNPPSSTNVTDYWYWDISPNNGATWYRMSNPYNTPGGTNYVYIDAPEYWSWVTESYTGISGDISDYAGYSVKFRFCFKADADTPIGTGIMIDNFTIFNDIFMPPPSNLTASLVDQDVELNWTAPPSGFSTVSITSTNEAWTSYINDADAYAMKIVNPFTSPLQLQGVKFMLYRPNEQPIVGNPTIHVFADSDGMPGSEIFNIPNLSNIPNMAWKEVDISAQNLIIPASGAVFVGISGVGGDAPDQGLLADSTSTVLNSYAMYNGEWDIVPNIYNGLKNWGLAATYWVDDPFAPILTSFKVYRSTNPQGPFDFLEHIPLPDLVSYTDASPVMGEINYYYVSAMFDGYESDPSNISQVDLIGLLYTELINDDGSSNQDFNLGTSTSSAVKFTTAPNAQIHYAKVYLNALGSTGLICRIYDADGADGLPETLLLQFTAAVGDLVVGWNNLPLPDTEILSDPDGIFYIAVMEYGNAHTFALDTDTSGDSWKKITSSAPWEPITEGNVMIRALVDIGSPNSDLVEVLPISRISNYPNPFARQTHISFELQKAGQVTVNIYNLKGQLVRSLTDQSFSRGLQTCVWDGRNKRGEKSGAGVYFCKVSSGGASLTRKLIIMD